MFGMFIKEIFRFVDFDFFDSCYPINTVIFKGQANYFKLFIIL